jgi:hypothetical protein
VTLGELSFAAEEELQRSTHIRIATSKRTSFLVSRAWLHT